MALRSVEQYKTGLADGRRVVYEGEYVDDVTTHAEGSFEAEKLQILHSYDADSVVGYVRELAGLSSA